jgi:hypothetical protein
MPGRIGYLPQEAGMALAQRVRRRMIVEFDANARGLQEAYLVCISGGLLK